MRGGKKPSGTLMSSGDRSAMPDFPMPSKVASMPPAQDVQDVLDTGLAIGREAPKIRPADHHGFGAEGQCLNDIGSATDTAIHDHLHIIAHGVDDLGKHPNRRR